MCCVRVILVYRLALVPMVLTLGTFATLASKQQRISAAKLATFAVGQQTITPYAKRKAEDDARKKVGQATEPCAAGFTKRIVALTTIVMCIYLGHRARICSDIRRIRVIVHEAGIRTRQKRRWAEPIHLCQRGFCSTRARFQ